MTSRDFIKCDSKKSKILKISEILSEMWLWLRPRYDSGPGVDTVECTSKIIRVDVEMSSFEYDLVMWNFVKRGRYHC